MPDILRMLSQAEQLDFSQNFLMPRANYLGDAIFPDQKTQNFKAEYLRLAAGAQLPTMALIHGLDTEAHIASRPALERVTVEKLFIKEKINQTESLRQALENGAFNDSALVTYVYDDWARLAEGVRCRSEAAKMEVLSTGKMTVKENGLNFSVDFGVPNGNTGFDIDVSTPDKNVLAQIEEIVETARDKGFTVSGMVLSGSVLSKMLTNEGISKAIYGGAGAGATLLDRGESCQLISGHVIRVFNENAAALNRQKVGSLCEADRSELFQDSLSRDLELFSRRLLSFLDCSLNFGFLQI